MAPSTVSISRSPTKGRSLQAAQAFKAGSVIATFEPLLLLPERAQITTVCAYCLKPGKPRGCTRCKASYYCDAKCQAAGWTAVHSRECVALATQIPSSKKRRELPTTVRMLMQVLLHDETKAAVAKLMGHTAEMRSRREWKDYEMMAMAACAFSGKGTGETTVREAVDLLCKLQTNAFHRYDVDFGQVGVFVEPTLAMANHSCVPTAVVQFVGRKAVLRAERAADKGDELEISYTDYTYPKVRRQTEVASYNFTCSCPRCSQDLTVYDVCAASPNVSLNQVSLASDTSRLRDHPAVNNSDLRKLANDTSVSLVEKESAYSESNATLKSKLGACRALIDKDLWAITPVPQTLTELSIMFAEQNKFELALPVSCLTATQCDPFRYDAPFHPVRIKNLHYIVKLLTNTAALTAQLQNPQSGTVAATSSQSDLESKVHDCLKEIDQVALAQMLLVLVLREAPGGDMDQLDMFVHARKMLADIAKLEGRGKENGLIEAWRKDPDNQETSAFFDYAVIKQVNALAELGKEVVQSVM